MNRKKPKTILDEAADVVYDSRQRDYGHALETHQRIATLWEAYLRILRPINQDRISALDVARMMILMKVARDLGTPKRDNLVDIAGYAACMEQIAHRYEAEEAQP